MTSTLSRSLKVALVVYGLYGLSFPIAAIPAFTDSIFTTVPSWWYLYVIIGGVAYFATLYGIARCKKWAAYALPGLLVVDTVGIGMLTKSVSIDYSFVTDLIVCLVVIGFWMYILFRNLERFQ